MSKQKYGYRKLQVWQEDHPEEARKARSEAGKKSGEVRAQKKMLKDLLELALSTKTETGDRWMDITTALIDKAEDGSVEAYRAIRETLGQNPVNQIEMNSNVVSINITGDDDDESL